MALCVKGPVCSLFLTAEAKSDISLYQQSTPLMKHLVPRGRLVPFLIYLQILKCNNKMCINENDKTLTHSQ